MDWRATYPNPHPPGCFWHDWASLTGSPNVKWCEETLCQVISEPANSWSNLLYLIIAIWMWKDSKKGNYHRVIKLYPPIIFIVGLNSLIYHISNIYPTQILDFLGMFLFVGWCIGINFIRLRKLKIGHLNIFLIIWSLVMFGLLNYFYLKEIKFQLIILFSGIVVFITEFFAKAEERRWFWISIGILIIAFAFSLVDHKRIFCNPLDHMIQGHALWHMISAVGLGTIWLHYRKLTDLE